MKRILLSAAAAVLAASVSLSPAAVLADNISETPVPELTVTEATPSPEPASSPEPSADPLLDELTITDTVCYSDIAAYINGYEIPSYNINGSTAVYVKDLANFGFTVTYDNDTRTTRIVQDKDTIEGMTGVLLPWQPNGTPFAEPGISGITVYAGDTPIPSANVNGYMVIYLKSLNVFGRVTFSQEMRKAFLNMDNLPEGLYMNLRKAISPVRRQLTSQYDLDPNDFYGYPTDRDDWGFVKNEGDEPSLYDWQKDVLAKYSSYYMNHDKPHTIYFTFDEGYEAGYTPMILDILEKYNVPATFFITGYYFESEPEIVQDMIDRGFDIGNHTVNHANLAETSPADTIYELGHLHDEVKNKFNYDMIYTRPPEGSYNERSLAIAEALGYSTVLWSFAYLDYDGVERGADYAYNNIVPYLHDGAILLLHTMSADNAHALEDVIKYAMEQGYTFGSLDDFCRHEYK